MCPFIGAEHAITTDQLVVRDDALELRATPLVHAIADKPVLEAQPLK